MVRNRDTRRDMRSALLLLSLVVIVTACSDQNRPGVDKNTNRITPDNIRSGYEFLTPDTQALQNDEFANPGFFWVEKGEGLFGDTSNETASCLSCHNDKLKGIAATYPSIDEESKQLLSIEGRINLCRERYQNKAPLEYESEELLAMTAFVTYQAKDMPIAVRTDGLASSHFENGKSYFFTRRGQFNLSCSQCHDENWGKKLRGDTISQGHPNGFPAYRFEWETFGSLHRRFRDCDTGVRAEPLPPGSQTYIDLQLYLAKRADGLSLESPAVRR